jgi:hypothetical protein
MAMIQRLLLRLYLWLTNYYYDPESNDVSDD